MRVFALILVALACACGTASAASSAPSFAAWMLRWNATDDKGFAAFDACAKVYANDDAKLGACQVKSAAKAYQRLTPVWSRQVAAITRGQSAPCRAAIHHYWLSMRKAQVLLVAYFQQHPKVLATTLASDLSSEPLKTTGALADESKSNAIRVCG